MKHLRLWVNEIKVHPQEYIKRYDIDYEIGIPQMISDQWWFWNCNNIPNELPKGLEFISLEYKDVEGLIK
jgi:hypothetical protein